MTRTLLLSEEKRKPSTLQTDWHNPGKEHLRGFVPARNGDVLSSRGLGPAWLPFKEFRSMQTLGIYKGPDVLPPRRNQLRISSREFTCDRDKPRYVRLGSRNFRFFFFFYTKNIRERGKSDVAVEGFFYRSLATQ